MKGGFCDKNVSKTYFQQTIYMGPYGPHMGFNVGPIWVCHMGPIWVLQPVYNWDPYGQHMGPIWVNLHLSS